MGSCAVRARCCRANVEKHSPRSCRIRATRVRPALLSRHAPEDRSQGDIISGACSPANHPFGGAVRPRVCVEDAHWKRVFVKATPSAEGA